MEGGDEAILNDILDAQKFVAERSKKLAPPNTQKGTTQALIVEEKRGTLHYFLDRIRASEKGMA